MLAGLLTALIPLQPAPTALVVAERMCIASAGTFEAFEQAGDALGVPMTEADIEAIRANPPRTMGRVSGYRVGEIKVVLMDLPGGVQNVPVPIGTEGEPVRMWDYNFPHSVACRVEAPSLPDGWASVIDNWTIEDAPLRPLGDDQASKRSWAFGGSGSVSAKTSNDAKSQIDIVYQRTP